MNWTKEKKSISEGQITYYDLKNSQHPEGKRLISFNVCIVFIWEYLACKYNYRLSINISDFIS